MGLLVVLAERTFTGHTAALLRRNDLLGEKDPGIARWADRDRHPQPLTGAG